MVLGHPSRSAISNPLITSSRISAKQTTRHCLRGERGGRDTTSSRTTRREANELSPPKSACAGDAVLRTSTRGTVHMGQCPGLQRTASHRVLVRVRRKLRLPLLLIHGSRSDNSSRIASRISRAVPPGSCAARKPATTCAAVWPRPAIPRV